jgi:NADH:ubiquinone oxidoreductase subunit E
VRLDEMPENIEALDRVWVLVCKGEACSRKGNPEKIRVALKQAARELPAKAVKVSYVSCLGMCGEGPNVVVCKGGTAFSRCTGSEGAAILEEVRKQVGRSDP